MLKLVLLVNLDPWVVRNFLKHSRWQREKHTKRCAEAYQRLCWSIPKYDNCLEQRHTHSDFLAHFLENEQRQPVTWTKVIDSICCQAFKWKLEFREICVDVLQPKTTRNTPVVEPVRFITHTKGEATPGSLGCQKGENGDGGLLQGTSFSWTT